MAEDRWGDTLFEASYGGVRLDIQVTEDEESRILQRSEYPYVTGADIKDRGGMARVTQCHIVFFHNDDDLLIDRTGSQDFRKRFDTLRALKNAGEPQTFVHPIDGEFTALIGNFRWSASSEPRDMIVVDCTFEECTTVAAVSGLTPGTAKRIGPQDVDADADTLRAAIHKGHEDDPELTDDTSACDLASSIVHGWDELQKDSRTINLELVRASNALDAMNDSLELASNLRRYPILRAITGLRSNLRLAAENFQQRTPRLIEIEVKAPVPLLVLMGRVYGARQASRRADEFNDLNDVRNPARIEPGKYRGQAPGDSSGLRSPR